MICAWELPLMPKRGWLKPAYRHIKSYLGNNLVGAAIGIAHGYGEEYVLDSLSIKKLYMIDPYVHFDFSAMTPELWEKQYNEAHDKFSKFDNTILWRLSSEEASQRIEDGSLDFVYIDGNHFYPSVKKDIELWWPKVRSGGVVGGHDYDDVPSDVNVEEHIHTWRVGETHYGVVKAVRDFSKNMSLILNFEKSESDHVYDWWINK